MRGDKGRKKGDGEKGKGGEGKKVKALDERVGVKGDAQVRPGEAV